MKAGAVAVGPGASNDNPYSEAFFQTCTYIPSWPARGFATIEEASACVHASVRWYNTEHGHSAIRFVAADAWHRGEDRPLLSTRHKLYQAARARNKGRWSGKTGKWDPVGLVWLNPSVREKDAKALGVSTRSPMKLAAAPPWPDTSGTQSETGSDDNCFDKHRPGPRKAFSNFERTGYISSGLEKLCRWNGVRMDMEANVFSAGAAARRCLIGSAMIALGTLHASAAAAFAQSAAIEAVHVPTARALASALADGAGISDVKLNEMNAMPAFKLFCNHEAADRPMILLTSIQMPDHMKDDCSRNERGEVSEAELGFITLVLVQKASDPPLSLSSAQLFKAVSAFEEQKVELLPSKVKSWSDVDPGLAATEVKVIVPIQTDESRKVFDGEVLVAGCRNFDAFKMMFEADERMEECTKTRVGAVVEIDTAAQRIEALKEAPPGAIALVPKSAIVGDGGELRVIPFGGYLPTPEDIVSEDYTLTVPLFVYAHTSVVSGPSRNETVRKLFLEAISERAIGDSGYMNELGFTTMPAASRDWQRRAIAD